MQMITRKVLLGPKVRDQVHIRKKVSLYFLNETGENYSGSVRITTKDGHKYKAVITKHASADIGQDSRHWQDFGQHNLKNETKGGDYSDQGWLNKCSLLPTCSSQPCMIQKDIPGCGGSIDLVCTGGCIKIIKVILL